MYGIPSIGPGDGTIKRGITTRVKIRLTASDTIVSCTVYNPAGIAGSASAQALGAQLRQVERAWADKNNVAVADTFSVMHLYTSPTGTGEDMINNTVSLVGGTGGTTVYAFPDYKLVGDPHMRRIGYTAYARNIANAILRGAPGLRATRLQGHRLVA